ncbi:hypothetical protein [Pedobacter heparinus]|uniref:Cell wall surface anchor family protein n=1 Tax=Pedobacter heparinus (strain ATCC 13125 / DSM 2366 / CIP 104194 / JCM 7457 / NBRC 12017 / NCIMB 9290 / NRRL B-14731 / HIM 762-3) TaxID=485917 RepID=C6Y3K5_PEDHD|nr:hypothetical protein [Pedobacter heparinus]ACU03284.1 hypothetical protein Phep_1065 [Pedobacter heparinus DSM 2366]
MKKYLFTTMLSTLVYASFGQVTNAFPVDGNVGVGTAVPQFKFHLVAGHANTSMNLHYPDPNPARVADLTLWASEPGWTYTGAGIGNNVYNHISGPGVIRISEAKGGSYMRLLDQELRLNIVKLDGTDISALAVNPLGNIGIGTTNPLANLHVIGAIRWGGENTNYLHTGQDVSGAYFEQVGTDADKSRIRFQTSKNGSGSNYAQLLIDPENGFSFLNLGAASSNVGIGTKDTKGYKLAVAGNMIAESVKVQLQGSWPDYVFTKDYPLPTLQQTEQHIKEKGHLPGIPSAEEVKANGIDLGEMNAKLLQKIEELTLHLIAQNKMIKAQQKEMDILKTSLATKLK